MKTHPTATDYIAWKDNNVGKMKMRTIPRRDSESCFCSEQKPMLPRDNSQFANDARLFVKRMNLATTYWNGGAYKYDEFETPSLLDFLAFMDDNATKKLCESQCFAQIWAPFPSPVVPPLDLNRQHYSRFGDWPQAFQKFATDFIDCIRGRELHHMQDDDLADLDVIPQLHAALAQKVIPVKVHANHNCFFNALSVLFFGNQDYSNHFRVAIAFAADENEHDVEKIISKMGQTFDEFISFTLTTNCIESWGSNAHHYVASLISGRPLCLIQTFRVSEVPKDDSILFSTFDDMYRQDQKGFIPNSSLDYESLSKEFKDEAGQHRHHYMIAAPGTENRVPLQIFYDGVHFTPLVFKSPATQPLPCFTKLVY